MLAAGKPLALVCYLAFSPRRTASREHLIDLLWSDAEPDRARHVLRQTLWYIRQTAGDDLVSAREAELVLRDDVTSDRDEFLRAVNHGDLDQAVALYQGEFLPGLAVPGGAAFDQWADVERYRLRSAFLRSGEALVRRRLASGHARDALPLARRLRDATPLNEQGWRLLLEAHAAAGDPVGAAMEAAALEQLLAAEGREPEPATRVMLRVARHAPADAPAGERGLVTELVGREREFSRLVQSWDEACRGRGRQVHLVSPAGFGKTRLLTEIQTRLRAGGGRVVALRALPGERHLAGGLIGELARALAPLAGAAAVSPSAAGTLVALHPAVSSFYGAPADLSTGEDALRRRTAALVELVSAVADEGPLALILDDLHWADVQSRAVLAGLSARIAKERVLLVTSARAGTPAAAAAAEALRIPLEPLTEADIRGLLASAARLPDEPWVEAVVPLLHDTAAGSPLLVFETLQLALERGLLALSDGAWECREADGLTRQLRSGSALRHRVAALDRTSAWLLLVLAVAGAPLSTEQLARVTRRPAADLEPVLAQLELRGLVAHVGDDWAPGHDEIGALAVEIAPPAATRAADKELGLLWLADGEREPALLARAGPHLAAAEEWAALERAFGAWVRRARRRGERRRARELATEFLGDAQSPSLADRLARSLPVLDRAGMDTPRRRIAVVAAGVVLLGGAGVAALHHPTLPDAVLLVTHPHGADSMTARAASVWRNEWHAGVPLSPAGTRPWIPTPSNDLPAWRPGTDQWLMAEPVPDSGVIDLFLERPRGEGKRITFAPGDDGGPTVSPDGRYVAMYSARYSPLDHYSLAILDLVSGTTRRLTRRENATDGGPQWSPDGTRIAFGRRFWIPAPAELCWASFDGTDGRCRPVSGGAPDIVGWVDSRRVAVLMGESGYHRLVIADVDDDSMTFIHDRVQTASVSPDGTWLADLETDPGDPSPRWVVRPLDAPELARPVATRGEPGSVRIAWSLPVWSPRYLARLVVDTRRDTVEVGVPERLEVTGTDPKGRPVVPTAVTFRSDDPDEAPVTADGILLPTHPGVVSIVASAGGWRRAATTVTILPARPTTLAREEWGPSWTDAWVPFGLPRPGIVRDGSAAWFWNNGDHSYASGVYSKARYSMERGLGVEAVVRAPVTAPQWQVINLTLTADLDSARLAAWNHRDGAPPTQTPTNSASCDAGVPAGEGPPAFQEVGLSSQGLAIRLPARWLDGTPHRVRVQIFPDGRCGLAVDGRAVAIVPGTLPVSARYLVMIAGNSVGSRMLVGPVTIWEGVRTDVDWLRIP